jgi:glycosyltransferase involved in cell wall biosynthesis
VRIALFMDAPRIGGAERYFLDLTSGLAAAGEDVHVASTVDGVLLPWLRERLGDAVTFHEVMERPLYDESLPRNVARSLRPYRDIRALLARIDPDVVHLSNGGYPGSHLCRAATFATRVPRVMTVNCRAQERRGGLGSVYAVLDPLVWRSLSRVIVPAQATADSLRDLRSAPEEILRVVNYGIDAHSADPVEVAAARAGLAPGGERLVGMVAAPSTADDIGFKGHDVLLDAVARTQRNGLRVAIVGHDPGPAFCERAEALGVAGRLAFLPGFHDAAPLMEAFDFLVVPSTRNEALPLVILEAMAAGTPVIASRLSGIPEAVVDGETGFTFAPGDADALARLLERAADPEEGAALGMNARERWRNRFSIDRMVRETRAVYGEARASNGAVKEARIDLPAPLRNRRSRV